MLDAFLTGSAARAEHYEIAAYTGLVSQARALGQRDAVALLNENLKQEKNALKKVETISKRLLKQANGSSQHSSSASGRKRSTSRASSSRRSTSTARAGSTRRSSSTRRRSTTSR